MSTIAKQQTAAWPSLVLEEWRGTYDTLHMWTQIVGKICLALTPKSNHWWSIAFQVTARGLLTPVMYYRGRSITILFDFMEHQLEIVCADGAIERMPLRPMTVAAFYREFMARLHSMGIDQKIWTMPVEYADPIRFTEDEVHHEYDVDKVVAFHQALLSMKPVFECFRCDFIGKCSPVHFFWGGFDLAVTRFSGRRAPARPSPNPTDAESYSHEVISHGFWPGSGPVQEAAFYAYAMPEPKGFSTAKIEPAAAYWHHEFKEFILPYEAVRTAVSPADELTKFLKTTYDVGATLANWNRSDLERN